MSRCRWTTCRRASFCFKYCVLHYYLQYKYKRRIYCGRKKLQIVATPATIELQEHFPLMDMASNFVKELRDLVKKKPKNGTVPSLSSVDDEEETDSPLTPRKFEQSFLDVQVNIRDLKSQISHQSKKNFTLDKDLRFLDSKIALLINHKISIEEIESRVFDNDSSSTSPPIALKGPLHLELYGQLFFLLQTSPQYVAHLTRMVSLKEIDGLLQIVMFTLYGNQYEDREEHLLLSMFEHTLTYEVQEATEINSLMRANTAITRMMTNYCRRGPGQEYVKSSLGVTLMELVSYTKSLEIDPVKIYQEMIDNDEVEGPSEPEKLLLEAEANPKVQAKIKEHVPVLQEYVLSILHQLKDSIDEVPFGIRWLCKATRSLVMEKFPTAEQETINSFIGGFFFLRYINPIIATPHAYRLISNPPPHQTRRNLTLVVKVIQKLANTSHVRESYMKPLEPFVKAHNEELKSFLSDLCEVEDFHESLQLEEYIALCRQDIAIDITVAEMACLHTLLLKYREDIITNSPLDDPLGKILTELPVPGDEMLANKHVPLTLDLIQQTRDDLELPTFAPHGVSLDMTDELATARRRCKHLLTRIFGMAPHCLQETTLDQAVTVALSSPLKDVVSNAELSRTQLETLTQLGGLVHQGKDLYEEIKEAFPEQQFLLQKAKLEFKSLNSVYMAMMEHCHFLEEQLDAYKEYLTAVRAKVGQVSGNTFRKPKGTHRFSHQQLEKEGVILESPGIPEQKKKGIGYVMSCSEPGIYCISMMYKGQSKAVYEKTLHLEDLLELQHLRDPVIDMEGIVVLNVRRTLLMLNRYFIRRETGSHRPVSRHFSAPALTALSASKS